MNNIPIQPFKYLSVFHEHIFIYLYHGRVTKQQHGSRQA
jgi:hypothetical protein